MKKLLIILSLVFISCSKDEIPQQEPITTLDCYKIISVGYDMTGDYVVIEYAPYDREKIYVSDYRVYKNKAEFCN